MRVAGDAAKDQSLSRFSDKALQQRLPLAHPKYIIGFAQAEGHSDFVHTSHGLQTV